MIENTKLDVRTKTTGVTSIVSNCIISNMSDSKDNRLNYGNYSVPPVVMKSETGETHFFTCLIQSPCLLNTLKDGCFSNSICQCENESVLRSSASEGNLEV